MTTTVITTVFRPSDFHSQATSSHIIFRPQATASHMIFHSKPSSVIGFFFEKKRYYFQVFWSPQIRKRYALSRLEEGKVAAVHKRTLQNPTFASSRLLLHPILILFRFITKYSYRTRSFQVYTTDFHTKQQYHTLEFQLYETPNTSIHGVAHELMDFLTITPYT